MFHSVVVNVIEVIVVIRLITDEVIAEGLLPTKTRDIMIQSMLADEFAAQFSQDGEHVLFVSLKVLSQKARWRHLAFTGGHVCSEVIDSIRTIQNNIVRIP